VGRDFRKIEAYQLAIQLVSEVYKLTKTFPRDELFGLISQLRRAAVSVPANIAEGATRKTKKEYLQFLYTAKGSMAEIECHLEISKNLGYMSNEQGAKIEALRNLVGSKLYRLTECVEAEAYKRQQDRMT
jgi:four helix bundle protein